MEERYLCRKQYKTSTKPNKKLCKEIKRDNFWHQKVGRVITKWGAI